MYEPLACGLIGGKYTSFCEYDTARSEIRDQYLSTAPDIPDKLHILHEFMEKALAEALRDTMKTMSTNENSDNRQVLDKSEWSKKKGRSHDRRSALRASLPDSECSTLVDYSSTTDGSTASDNSHFHDVDWMDAIHDGVSTAILNASDQRHCRKDQQAYSGWKGFQSCGENLSDTARQPFQVTSLPRSNSTVFDPIDGASHDHACFALPSSISSGCDSTTRAAFFGDSEVEEAEWVRPPLECGPLTSFSYLIDSVIYDYRFHQF